MFEIICFISLKVLFLFIIIITLIVMRLSMYFNSAIKVQASIYHEIIESDIDSLRYA